jgi:1-acyl-sn-glycerol-3-phosphate acyltransferase
MDNASQTAEPSYGWRRTLFRFGLWNVVYRFWLRLHIDGWDNIPAENPVVMMGNHMHAIDPGVMISFFPDRDIVPLAKTEAFETPIMRYFVSHWGAIRIARGEADLQAFKLTLDHIRRGDIVMLYAEGTRSKTGLIQGQEGSAYLALKTDALVVPVAIWGSRDFPFGWWRNWRRVDIHVRFGHPFRFKQSGGRTPRELLRPMTDQAMVQIASLLPPEWRGVYADLAQSSTDHLDFDVAWTPVKTRLPRWVSADFGMTLRHNQTPRLAES